MEPSSIIEAVNCVVPPVCRYWKYHINFKGYLSTLKSMKEELNSRKEDIEQRLHAESRFGKIARKEVEIWLRKAKNIIDETQRVEEKASKSKYLLRACRAKLADEKIREVMLVYNKGSFSDSLVIDAPEENGMELPTSELVGETSIREKIWEHLISDRICKIGVCGMGGVGKTTIMKHIHNQLLKETKFEKVIWVTVSEESDVVKLQKDIALALGEDLSRDEDKITRAAKLSKMLERRKRYVLILDDVWKRFSLEDVGIPEATVANGCKLVLTTRSIVVAQSMDCEITKVELLSEMEALNLFLNKVGHGILHIPTLKSTLKLVVKQCAGLPLAIVTVASSMKGEYDPRMWKNALNELERRVAMFEGMDDQVLERLKFSYDRLRDPKLKHCFLYCALYPEDYVIDKEKLIEYWIVEGLIDEMETRQAMHYNGHAILKRLENNCLLESAEDGKCVKMHDLVRDMALHITSSSPRYLVKAGLQLKELPSEHEWAKDLEKVSLMRNRIKEILLDMALPNFTALSTLLLQNNNVSRIPESFFMRMIGLKILDLSYTEIVYLPNSISDLQNLRALLLHNCFRLSHVPSLAKLGALKKLDLTYTHIKVIPEGIEMLLHLKYLDLHGCDIREVPGGILPKLCRLQYLRLGKAFAKVEEVTRLSNLESVGMLFNSLQDYHLYLSLQQQRCLNKYSLIVKPDRRTSIEAIDRRSVKFSGFSFCGDSILFPTDMQALEIEFCNNVRSLSDISSLKDATDLRYCTIKFCKQIESVLYFSSCSSILQSIEQLKLEGLDNLGVLLAEERCREVANCRLPTATPPCVFSSLKIVEISNCPRLERLLLPDLLPHLQNLEKIHLYNCSRLVEVVAASGDEEEDMEARKNSVSLALPRLRHISLFDLQELKSFCNGRYAIVCNSLETISVANCPKLKRICPLLPQPDNGLPFPPPSLRRIDVYPKESCDSLEWSHPSTKTILQRFLTHGGHDFLACILRSKMQHLLHLQQNVLSTQASFN